MLLLLSMRTDVGFAPPPCATAQRSNLQPGAGTAIWLTVLPGASLVRGGFTRTFPEPTEVSVRLYSDGTPLLRSSAPWPLRNRIVDTGPASAPEGSTGRSVRGSATEIAVSGSMP